MNQILVTEKVIVTPEYRRKKKIYKFNFFLSVFLVCILFSCYIYAEYDRNKSEEVSQEILLGLQNTSNNKPEETNIDATTISVEDNILYVTLFDTMPNESTEVDITSLLESIHYEQEQYMENEEENMRINIEQQNEEEVILHSNEVNRQNEQQRQHTIVESRTTVGDTYYSESILKIPSLDIEYPILSDTSDELLKVSLNKLWGPSPNEVGNYVIVGHNYKSGKMFGKLKNISIGDIVTLEDLTGRVITYKVYDKYVIEPTDVQCTSQMTNGKKEVTLITCQNSGKQRLVVKAMEVV